MSAAPEAVTRLSRDLAAAAGELGDDAARFLVDAYYSIQAERIRADNQMRALAEAGEPVAVLDWLAENARTLENQIKRALHRYAQSRPAGEWALAQMGIGPVLTAGLLAHIDFERAQTAGAIWRFAGLDPSAEWAKGQRRPHNARLKTLCWKIGESFVKVANREGAFYGQIYAQRKALENQRNEAGEFADQAARKLEKFKIGKTTDAYKHYAAGQLPPAHIHARAKRYAVKLFLAHLHEIGWRRELKKEPPMPYALSALDHAHRIEPPAG